VTLRIFNSPFNHVTWLYPMIQIHITIVLHIRVLFLITINSSKVLCSSHRGADEHNTSLLVSVEKWAFRNSQTDTKPFSLRSIFIWGFLKDDNFGLSYFFLKDFGFFLEEFFEDYLFAWWNIWIFIILLLPSNTFCCKWHKVMVCHTPCFFFSFAHDVTSLDPLNIWAPSCFTLPVTMIKLFFCGHNNLL
jgi:hypothetical protein